MMTAALTAAEVNEFAITELRQLLEDLEAGRVTCKRLVERHYFAGQRTVEVLLTVPQGSAVQSAPSCGVPATAIAAPLPCPANR
jgi:hypothetical protein